MRWFNFLFLSLVFFSCSNSGNELNQVPVITVSIRPQKYMVEQIAGDRFDIHVLVPDGSGPETYEPTARQMQEISKSSACFITGLLDFEKTWIHEVSELYPELKIVNLSEGVNLITGVHLHEGEHSEQEQHQEADHQEDGDHNHSGTDPHIWLSLKELRIQSNTILKALVKLDSDNKEYYTENFTRFVRYLDSSDVAIQSKIKSYGQPVIYMIYHPSLSYFARDYGLEQVPIELEGKEPGPAYMRDLIDLARVKKINTIYYAPQLDKKSPLTIAKQLGIEAKLFNDLDGDIVNNLLNLTNELTLSPASTIKKQKN